MRLPIAAVLCLALTSVVTGQSSAPAASPENSARLPVTRVVLYKNGVGYFEHSGHVHGSQDVNVDFTTAQLNDVLKSLTVLDLGKGRITGVSYNSRRWNAGSDRCACRWGRIRPRRSFWTRCVAPASRFTAARHPPPDACSASKSEPHPTRAATKPRAKTMPAAERA